MRTVTRFAVLVMALSIPIPAHAHATSLNAPSGPRQVASLPALDSDTGVNASAESDTEHLRAAIQKRASRVSNQTRANADRRFAEACGKVDEAARESEGLVAKRIGDEFGVPASTLVQEHTASGAGWGDVLVAHVVVANTRTPVAAATLLRWRHDGMTWSQLASGLGLSLSSSVSAVDVESRVACGMQRADGRIAAVYGENARGDGPRLDIGRGGRRDRTTYGVITGTDAGLKIGH